MSTSKNATPVAKTQSVTDKPEMSNLSVSRPPEKNTPDDVDKVTGEISQTSQEQPAVKKPSIDEIFERMEELEELKEKREKVITHLTGLNKFYVDPAGSGCNLKLTDSKGNVVGISHPSVIGEIIHMSKEKMQDELTRLETAITSFF